MESADVLMEEKKLMAEAKYRNYMSNIDKALRNFEYSSEWADLISALGKLSKAISSNTQYQVIPRRIKISKRLAQCMHPALPSGVHLKALETYGVIFGKTGPERLATELFIYSSGLFPLLGYAAMNVRPALLGIYETYFVPLGEKLRPALSGFLSGVLPGYECGLDHFERTSSLLTQVCTAVNPTHFYTVLWECVATNASVRLPAISYLLEHFNKRMSMQQQVYVMGHNRDIMMSGLCACLNDNVILVQRNTLEFLLLGFPMHTKLLADSDLAKLVTNGLNTILRRDMSLNRRLYSWLLGSEILKNSPTYETEPALPAATTSSSTGTDGVSADSSQSESYFEKHSRHVVIKALITTLKFSLECSPVDLKPYRIMVSLLDKAEIGSAVLDYVLCDIIRTMSLSIGNVEVIKSSNLLFATFDPAYIWSFMTTMFEKSCKKVKQSTDMNKDHYFRSNSFGSSSNGSGEQRFHCVVGSGDPSLVEICYLTEFLLETISLEMYNETTRIYLPKVFLAITQMLTVHLENLADEEITASLKLCMKIVSRVQPMITSPIKLMPRPQQKSTNDDKSANNVTAVRSQPLSALVGANSLEKSKSDSKLDQFANQEDMLNSNSLNRDEDNIRRSNSNQNMDRKSPTKKKKAKSFSKLSELDKEICPDTGQLIDPRQSSSDLDTPTSIKKIKAKGKLAHNRLRMSPKKSRPQELVLPENRHTTGSDYVHSNTETPLLEDYQEEEPKSAPLEYRSNQNSAGINSIFNYQDVSQEDELCHTNDNYTATASILEKCIKQYEFFFEVYLSHKVLGVQQQESEEKKCPITLQVEKQEALTLDPNKIPNVENIFKHEHVYEDVNPHRLLDIDNLFETLKIHLINRSKQLHSLLNRTLIDGQSENTDCSDDAEESARLYEIDDSTNKSLQYLLDLQLTPSLRQAVKLSVNLLVEMSTFPNCNKNITLEKAEKELPSWLKVLCIIACYSQNDKELQLSAVTTLFDLISLLKSQIEHTTSPGVTYVVMLPLLKFGHVHYIERRTRVFQLLTSNLWDYLGEHDVDNAQVCALLYQLHNCLESGLVERIIDNRMYAKTMQQHFTAAYEATAADGNVVMRKSEKPPTAWGSYNYDRATDIHIMCVNPTTMVKRSAIERLSESESISFKKYELLWHLGRDKQQTRGFEKIQFKVLDTLALPPYMSVRTCVTKWLQSALLRGDLSRLVKPLYKILLASNTKRVGIVHLHLLRKGSEENQSSDVTKNSSGNRSSKNNSGDVDSSVEADVYAVSSEYGNIRYITDSASHNKKRSPIRSIQKKIFGVSLSSKNKTSNFVSDQTSSSTSPNVGAIDVAAVSTATTIGLIVNPLENSLDFDDEQELPSQEDFKNNKKAPTPIDDFEPEDLDEEGENDDPAFDQDYTDESDSSIFDSESEQRETSAEKDDSITVQSYEYENKTHLKRFVGHTESVTELLSQHERTKNRKTYHLTREKTPGETSLTSTTTEEHGPLSLELEHDDEEVHPAEEYFDSKSEERQVESFVDDLIDQVRDRSISSKRKKKSKNHLKKLRSKKSSSHLSGQEKMDKKRMSCISKISTDSNNSFTTGEIAKENEDEEDNSSRFINIEEKRKTLNLETSKSLNKEWELTPETLEKSKQNLEILRQSASSQLLKHDLSSKRSSTKSSLSYDGSKRLPNDKLPPVFQNHMLIYMNVYDSKQTLYAFHTLRNIISCDTRTFLCLSITTSLSSGSLKQLLTRHRKCIAGKGFLGSITTSEFAQSYRGCMHLEVLLLLCLFYARGFFHVESHDSASEPPTRADILGNCRVQLESIELLTLICTELIDIVKGMGKGLACYLADLMARCKLQKVILHCLNSSVNTYGHLYEGSTMAEQIINFNNPHDDNLHAEALQIQLLRLLMVVIKLEYEVILLKNDLTATSSNDQIDSGGSISPTRLSSGETQFVSVKYLPNCVISQQPMFLSAILSALQDSRLQLLHHNWTDLVTSSLNCFKFGSLTNIVISVVHQLCNNIDQLTNKIKQNDQRGLPPDYVISQLEAITVLCHYCLLDNTQQTTLSQLFNQAYPQTSSIASQNSNTGQLFNSIVHSLLPGGPSGNSTTNQADSQAPKNSQLLAARNAVLSHLPRIVSSVAAVWDSDLGQIRQIKQQLMEFLSPISLHHGSNFLAAIAVTWQERGEQHRKRSAHEYKNLTIPQQYQRNSVPQACTEQLSLVSLVSSIRVMPMDSFVQTLHQVVKSPPPIHRPPTNLKIEVSALELFYFYLRSAPAPQLGDSWTSLLALLRDGLSLTPPAQFTLLMLLNEFVQRCPQMPFQDKKDIRDLHDVTSRLVDSLSNVAGSCLEQTNWLRRNLAVKEDITPLVTDGDSASTSASSGGTAILQKYSVQAQSVLAAILANLLDVAYGSQEKDKVVSIITTLLYNITPYLKNHTTRNVPSFYACSSLLASLSGYQYTRKAWRKDMMDLLLDTSFFQMDITCLPFWKQIMDSLMTYDNTTFRELMSRVSLTQTGSLNIFASREQEYEQRSMLLKRLAFVIFCSEFDQYHKYMPEIQEQLANSLRLLSNVPSVQAAVFLCFRVLLLRMSPDHVTSLWPIIIAEMVQVFLAMEQELKTDGDDLSQHIRMVSGMDSSWSSSAANNGITSQSQLFYWRSVQLEASKLLEMGCVLPATLLPHFQMYRWAFVGTEFDVSDKTIPNGMVNEENLGQTALYVPHIRRIARLMDMKYTVHSPTLNIRRGRHLMLTSQQINTLQDLYSFFSTLSVACPNPHNYADVDHEVNNCLQEIEEILSKDFLEKMSSSTSTPR